MCEKCVYFDGEGLRCKIQTIQVLGCAPACELFKANDGLFYKPFANLEAV